MAIGLLAAGLTLLAQDAFWNLRAPADWSIEEVRQLLQASPWAAVSTATRSSPIRMHLASAEPMREAEIRERQAGRRTLPTGPSYEEYQALVAEGRYLVLAIFLPDGKALSDGVESKSLERDSVLHIGKRSYKLVTNFPPSSGDPYLRYVFPRDVRAGDKALLFEIYIPGVVYPQRHIEFDLKSMIYRGRLAY